MNFLPSTPFNSGTVQTKTNRNSEHTSRFTWRHLPPWVTPTPWRQTQAVRARGTKWSKQNLDALTGDTISKCPEFHSHLKVPLQSGQKAHVPVWNHSCYPKAWTYRKSALPRNDTVTNGKKKKEANYHMKMSVSERENTANTLSRTEQSSTPWLVVGVTPKLSSQLGQTFKRQVFTSLILTVTPPGHT